MSTHATATFELKSWEEKPYDEMEGGPKLTRASNTKSFKGDIKGEGTLEYLMVYRDDGLGQFCRPGAHRRLRRGALCSSIAGPSRAAQQRPLSLWCRALAPGTCAACGARVALLLGTPIVIPLRSITISRDDDPCRSLSLPSPRSAWGN